MSDRKIEIKTICEASLRKRPRRYAITLFVVLVFAYILTHGGHLYSPDEEVMFRVTESVALGHGFAIEPFIGGFATRPRSRVDAATGDSVAVPRADGREYPQYGIGQPIAALPFYLLGQGLASIGNGDAWFSLARRVRTTGAFADVYPDDITLEDSRKEGRAYAVRLGVAFFNVLVMALTGVIVFLIIYHATRDDAAALMTGLLWGLGTVMWTYSRMFYSEPLAGLCVLMAFYLVMRGLDYEATKNTERIRILLAGCVMGFGCLVRLDSVIFCPMLGLYAMFGRYDTTQPLGWDAWKYSIIEALRLPSVWMRLVLLALPVMVAGGVIMALNTRWYGSPLASGYSDQPEGINFSTPLLAGLFGFLASVGKGMFFFSPVLVLIFFGFHRMFSRVPVFCVTVLGAGLMFLLVMSKWQNWAGGWCWGPRHILQIHALLILPVGFWLADNWYGLRRKVVIALLAVSAAVQVYGCSQSFFEYYHLYFRSPEPPNAYIVNGAENRSVYYMGGSVGGLVDRVSRRPVRLILQDAQSGQPIRELSPVEYLRAPISDSIYQPQNSQWARYMDMYREPGVHDFLWLHVLSLMLS